MLLPLLLSYLLGISSCATGPNVTVCLTTKGSVTMQCADGDGNKFQKPIPDNDVCMSPQDSETLYTYWQEKAKCQ